jgi:Holliday junction resolvasome RuvABC endonuclease subunit
MTTKTRSREKTDQKTSQKTGGIVALPQPLIHIPHRVPRSLGLDTGIAKLGWAVIDGEDTLVDCGLSKTKAGVPMGRRLAELEADLIWIFEEFHPTQVGIEFPFFDRDKPSQGKVLAALGIMSRNCDRYSIIPSVYHQATVKASVAHGTADKHEVALAVAQLFGVDGVEDDVSDACAIAYCCAIGTTSNIAW